MRRERPAGEVPPAGLSCLRWNFPFLGWLAIVLMGLMRHTNCLAKLLCFDVALLR